MSDTKRAVRKLTLVPLDECDAAFDVVQGCGPIERRRQALARLVEPHQFINVSLGRGNLFWRARKCPPGGFAHEKELWCPPPGLASVGRINDTGESCLYLSTRRETALTEISATTGDHVQLSVFRIKPDRHIRVLTIGEWLHIQRTGRSRIFSDEQTRGIESVLNGFPYEYARSLVYVDSIFGSIMSDMNAKNDNYLLTRTLGCQAFGKVPSADALFYPSVQLSLGMNLAVKADSATAKVEEVASLLTKVERKRHFGMFDCKVLRSATGTDKEGHYHWRDVEDPREYFMYRLTDAERQLAPRNVSELLRGPKATC